MDNSKEPFDSFIFELAFCEATEAVTNGPWYDTLEGPP